jgi:tetratricopeptide (TPR) repeat protein
VAGVVGVSALAIAMYLLGGSVGLVVVVLVLQLVTLAALAKTRIDLGRETRTGERRLERRILGRLNGHSTRLQQVERKLEALGQVFTHPRLQRAAELEDQGYGREALELYNGLLEVDPSDAGVRSRLADALRELGREDEAREHIALLPNAGDATFRLLPDAVRFEALRLRCALRVDPPKANALAAEVQRQLNAGAIAHGLALAEQGIELYPESIRVNDRLVSALDAVGDPRRALEVAAGNARRRIANLSGRRPEVKHERSLSSRQRVMIAGFFYSGSSAVLDHLLGFPGAVKWTPAGEMRLIKFPGGFGELLERQRSAAGLDHQALLDLYLHLVGRKVVGHGSEIYSTWGMVNRNSRRLLGNDAASGYLQVCLEGFHDLLGSSVSASELMERCRSTVERALDAAATDTEADLLVVDQAVTGWRLELASLLPPSTFVVVHRDPRDQFAEVKEILAKPGRQRQHSRTPEGFAHRYRQDREQAERVIPELERRYGHRFVRIGFEDFVVDHAHQAARLCDELDLDLQELVTSRFDPAISRHNVGKHTQHLTEEDADELCRRLPEYLSRHADRPHTVGELVR